MARRGYGPAARWQPNEPSPNATGGAVEAPSGSGSPPPGEDSPVEGQLEFVKISPLKRLPFFGKKTSSVAELRQAGTPIARLRRPSGGLAAWFGRPELHFATTRMRLADPPDAGFFQQLQRNVGFFGMPQRQEVWRAGAGTVTQIEETSTDRKTLSGLFSYRDDHYQLNGERTDRRGLFSYTLRDNRDMVATLRPKQETGLTGGWFVEVIHPRPVGAIAIACHMAMWLEQSTGDSSVAAGGAAGGGGGGGGGC
ncbi:hypothetical protein [Thioalkalivibrio sp. ALJ24]|uniref:hypothetical protein n=1 Tax=Thioalkalivibrio sp. ALJ24 TaxID=545276 RepID=UPI00035D7A3C|nr:hypothetical protein [Thioalkalivibrio sp. ALJ24]